MSFTTLTEVCSAAIWPDQPASILAARYFTTRPSRTQANIRFNGTAIPVMLVHYITTRRRYMNGHHRYSHIRGPGYLSGAARQYLNSGSEEDE